MNNNLSCIPFYKTKEEQDFRLWYAFGQQYPHYVPSNFLIPFFFFIDYNPNTEIDSVDFFRACCDEDEVTGNGSFNPSFSNAFAVYDVNFGEALFANGLVVTVDDDAERAFITYFAKPSSPLNIPKGAYYIKITTNYGDEWYSDVFFVEAPSDISRRVMVEWYNRDNLPFEGGFVPYEESYNSQYYKNKIYLDTTIGMPEYSFTEDGEERNGHFFPIKQISEKTYKMSFIAPEYLCDVMRLIRMSDIIKVTDGLGRVYNVEQFEMNVTWAEQGHYAEVECSFQTDTVVKKVGKAYNNLIER